MANCCESDKSNRILPKKNRNSSSRPSVGDDVVGSVGFIVGAVVGFGVAATKRVGNIVGCGCGGAVTGTMGCGARVGNLVVGLKSGVGLGVIRIGEGVGRGDGAIVVIGVDTVSLLESASLNGPTCKNSTPSSIINRIMAMAVSKQMMQQIESSRQFRFCICSSSPVKLSRLRLLVGLLLLLPRFLV